MAAGSKDMAERPFARPCGRQKQRPLAFSGLSLGRDPTIQRKPMMENQMGKNMKNTCKLGLCRGDKDPIAKQTNNTYTGPKSLQILPTLGYVDPYTSL